MVKPQGSIRDQAIELMEIGISTIPVSMKSKKAAVAWSDYQQRLPTEKEIDQWFLDLNTNLAIITGCISKLVVVDADGPEGEQWIGSNLPYTPVRTRTGKSKHFYYKHPGNGTKVKSINGFVKQVDIKGDGGYVVAPPSVHENGKRYEWEIDWDAWDGEIESLPVFILPEIIKNSPIDETHGNLSLDLSQIQSLPVLRTVEKGERNATLTQIVGKWIHEGKTKHETILMAKGWNCDNPEPLDLKEVITTVESVWKTHLRNHPKEAKSTACQEISVFINGETPETVDNMPVFILSPGGLLQELMQYIDANSAVSHPLFNLGGAVAFLGSLAGQRVMTETGLRTNIYTVVLGYSGSGKDAPQSALPKLLFGTKVHNVLGATEFTSSASILMGLKNQPSNIMFIDEIGMIFQAFKNQKSHMADIPRVLTKLFSSTDRPETKKYADDKNDVFIPWHHQAFYGASTPEMFWENITLNDVASGFIARILLWESRHDPIRPKEIIRFDVPKDLMRKVIEVYEIPYETCGGNLMPVPVPNIISKSKEAMKIFKKWEDKYHELRVAHKTDPVTTAIYGRAAEHAHKLALIHAVSLYGQDVLKQQVNPESVNWAVGLIDHLITNMVEQIKDNIAENDYHKWEQRIIRAIKNKANIEKPGLTKRDLVRHIKGLSYKNFHEIMDMHLIAERIYKINWKPPTGPETDLYCLSSDYAES